MQDQGCCCCFSFPCFGRRKPKYQVGYRARTKLQKAASKGQLDRLQRLLDSQQCCVNEADGQRRRMALHFASAYGHPHVVTFLLERQCAVNMYDTEHCTAVMKAAQRQHTECVQILVRNGADTNFADHGGNTALHYAVLNEDTVIATELLSHNANIEAGNKLGLTPLLLAFRENKQSMIDFLLDRGANIHAIDDIGRSSIMLAIKYGSRHRVKFLILQGVDVFTKDFNQKTALCYARESGCDMCMELITSAQDLRPKRPKRRFCAGPSLIPELTPVRPPDSPYWNEKYQQQKNIILCGWPAADIDPKPAVPCIPAPRSPSQSSVRPRPCGQSEKRRPLRFLETLSSGEEVDVESQSEERPVFRKPPPSPEVPETELFHLRKKTQELVNENNDLKMLIHHLNLQMSRYQAEFGCSSKEETFHIEDLPSEGPIPPWLEEMRTLKTRVDEVEKENEELQLKIKKSSLDAREKWCLFLNRVEVIWKESSTVADQLKIMEEKAKDTHEKHLQEVSLLVKKLKLLEKKTQVQEEALMKSRKRKERLKDKCQKLQAQVDGMIAMETHTSIVNDLKSQLQEAEERASAKMEELTQELTGLQGQKESLLLEKNHLTARNQALETEIEEERKIKRELSKDFQNELNILKKSLKSAMRGEESATWHLENLISVTENMAHERDSLLIRLGQCKESENPRVRHRIIRDDTRLERLEEELKSSKRQAARKLDRISHRMAEQEMDFADQKAQYQLEIRHLRRIIQEKQEVLDKVQRQKRIMENQLEDFCKPTSTENHRMPELVKETPEKTSTWDASRAFQDPCPNTSSQRNLYSWTSSYGHNN